MANNPRYTVTISPKRGGVPVGGTTGQVLTKIDNTDWNISWQTATGGGASSFSQLTGTLALSQTSMNTNKLLGRGTASVGPFEEITLGTNLSFTGTTLNASGGGSVAWGAITGTLSSQTDLQTALNAKVVATRTLRVGPDTFDLSADRTFLASVTDDVQTKNSIVPNTAPTAGQILVGNAGNTAYAKQTLSGSGATATLGATGVLTLSAIPNATLSNSAITIAGTSTSLGGSITLTTILGFAVGQLSTWAGVTPAANVATFLATPTSANLAAAVTNETGSGLLVFGTSPNITTPTGIVKGDVGLGNVDNTSDATKNSATSTLTNKRVTKRAPAVTQSATPTINTDVTDVAHITGLAQAITSMTTNLSGTPVEGDTLRIDFTDNGTARAITWGTSFEASTVALPTTTVISTRLDTGFVWNSVTNKWRIVASA